MSMSDRDKPLTNRGLEEMFEKGNLGAAEELVHPAFINHEVPPGGAQGPEGLKEAVAWLRGLWGPMRFDLLDEICEGDNALHAPRRPSSPKPQPVELAV
jgi:hypothetical protein